MRANSLAMRSFSLKMSLSVSAILPATPVWSTGRRTEKSPSLKAIKVFNNVLVSSASVTSSVCIAGSFAAGDSATRARRAVAFVCSNKLLEYCSQAEKLLQIRWLSQIARGAQLAGNQAVARGIRRGQDHHRNVGKFRRLAQPLQDFDAIVPWQVQIEDNQAQLRASACSCF